MVNHKYDAHGFCYLHLQLTIAITMNKLYTLLLQTGILVCLSLMLYSCKTSKGSMIYVGYKESRMLKDFQYVINKYASTAELIHINDHSYYYVFDDTVAKMDIFFEIDSISNEVVYQKVVMQCSPCYEKHFDMVVKDKKYKWKKQEDGINYISKNKKVLLRAKEYSEKENGCGIITAHRIRKE